MSDLIQAMKEVLAHQSGDLKLNERPVTLRPSEIHMIRTKFHLSQREFASLFGVSVRTLQQWEQGRRVPRGAASMLLRIISKHPDAVMDVMCA